MRASIQRASVGVPVCSYPWGRTDLHAICIYLHVICSGPCATSLLGQVYNATVLLLRALRSIML
jgi:hypothetical protein